MSNLCHTKSDEGNFKTNSPIAFFADAMLGKLARWLRMLGHDTAYQSDIPDAELVERVIQEDRWLLTRDSYLTQRKVLRGRFILLDSDFIFGAMRATSDTTRDSTMRRCEHTFTLCDV